MDIFAHGLWATAAAIGVKRKAPVRIRVGWAAWWGVFPDLFAFTIPFTVMIWHRLLDSAATDVPHGLPHLSLAWQLYQFSHSLVIFAAVFGVVRLLAGRPVLELLTWPLHILLDIPTHTLRFFPTPFLWPISSFKASGISWATPWFMLLNYGALATVFLLLWWTGRRKVGLRPEVETGSRR